MENILTLSGLGILIFQVNQHAISSIKEKKIQAYSRFVEAAQSALPPIGQKSSDEAMKALSSALMEMAMFSAPEVLIEIASLKDDQGNIEINDVKLVSLRLKIRKDTNLKWWEYIPLVNWIKYGIAENKIKREHMMLIRFWNN